VRRGTRSCGRAEAQEDLLGATLALTAWHADAKPLQGYGGAGVVEILRDHKGDTFRTVYTVRLAGALYVLHAFQKKSKTGSETPKTEMDLIHSRLREAERIAKERQL
jgi:phage-related protein